MTSRSYIFTINNPQTTLTFTEDKVRYASWQKEKGDNGTLHYQGYMELKGAYRIAAIKKWGGEWERAHLEKRRGSPEQARNYTRKEESRVEGPWEFGKWEKEQGKRSDLQEVYEELEEGTSVEEVAENHPGAFIRYNRGIRELAEVIHRRKRAKMDNVELRAWQSELVEYINGEPDGRKIRWYVDSSGNTGKSFMARYLASNYNALPLSNAKHDRIINAVQQHKPTIVTFDFARDTIMGDNDRVPYGPIEAIKNGLIFSGFFGAGPFIFPVPHVICFSNFEPDRTKFSEDRWDIVYL